MKRKIAMMDNHLNAAHIVAALGDAEVVVLTQPDGSQHVLRGAGLLARIMKGGYCESVDLFTLSVCNIVEAEIIAAAMQVIEAGGMGPAKIMSLQRLLDQARTLQ